MSKKNDNETRRWTTCGECAHHEVCVAIWTLPTKPGYDNMSHKTYRKGGLREYDTPHCGDFMAKPT